MKIGGLKMRISKNELAEKLVDFCVTNNLLSEPEKINISVDTIAMQLEYGWYIVQLIEFLIIRASNMEHIDLRTLKELFIELENLRINLENELE